MNSQFHHFLQYLFVNLHFPHNKNLLWDSPIYFNLRTIRPVLKIILLGVTRPYDSKTPVWLYGIGKKLKIHFNYFFMLKFCLYLSFDWCFASTPCTMHRYSQNCVNIKSFSDIEISAYLRFLRCVRIWDQLACLWG